jgi:hypothetical protein
MDDLKEFLACSACTLLCAGIVYGGFAAVWFLIN